MKNKYQLVLFAYTGYIGTESGKLIIRSCKFWVLDGKVTEEVVRLIEEKVIYLKGFEEGPIKNLYTMSFSFLDNFQEYEAKENPDLIKEF